VGVGVGFRVDKDEGERSLSATKAATTPLTTIMTTNMITTILVTADFEEKTRILFFNLPLVFLQDMGYVILTAFYLLFPNYEYIIAGACC